MAKVVNNLVVTTYNNQGHSLGKIEYISELLKKSDLLLWLEHWFLTKELHQVASKFCDKFWNVWYRRICNYGG